MPGARGHLNERGPVFGKLTISPKAKRQIKQLNGSTMARRTQILQSMGSGGTTAPNARRAQIKKALAGAGGPAPMRFPQVGRQPARGNAIANPSKIGGQLAGRVATGAINEQQATKVAQQRQTLRKAFGSDWRKQVYGQGGAKGIGGPFAQRQVAAKRQQGLQRAKRKLY